MKKYKVTFQLGAGYVSGDFTFRNESVNVEVSPHWNEATHAEWKGAEILGLQTYYSACVEPINL